jgi:hypothetical protein
MHHCQRMICLGLGLAFALALLPDVVHASETVTYTYDANGRLVSAVTAGGFSNGVQDTYSYDEADNIKQRVSVGVPPRPTGVIVVPLNGFTIIPTYQ